MGIKITDSAKKGWKMAGIVLVLLVAAGGIYKLNHTDKKVGLSSTVQSSQAQAMIEQKGKTVEVSIAPPDFNNPSSTGTPVIFQVPEWNAMLGLMFAVGGENTSRGSLFDSAHINAHIKRQDNFNTTFKEFEANANQYAKDKNTPPMIVAMMYDGTPGASVALNAISKLKGNNRPIVFDFIGRSNGEDCFWGPASWKIHPKDALGKCVVGVERDGDMNIVIQWCSINNIPMNVDTKVLDRDALNIISATDYNVGDDNGGVVPKVLSGFTEKRKVKRNGIIYADSVEDIHCDSWTSWTPVDKTIAAGMGGFTRLASTAEFTTQMPCALIINNAWAVDHPKQMYDMVKALGVAGDQIRSFEPAQEFAAKVSAKVYNDKDANYWLRYYNGVTENDKKGNAVQLGGSLAYNLADAANMFGLGADGQDRAKITYDNFGSILNKLYPKEMKGYLPYEKMVDKQYVQYVLDHNADLKSGKTENDNVQYAEGNVVTDQVGSAAYNIQFDKGKATILPASYPALAKIYKDAMQGERLTIFIIGHTDNTGSDAINQPLSEQRAEAVKQYLINVKHIPAKRIPSVKGVGSSVPLDGTTASDPANRCVEIKLGS